MTPTASDQASHAFGVLLKGYRVRAELTQEQLSEGSGVSVRAISDMERGIARSPQRRTIESLAATLRLTEDELAYLRKSSKLSRDLLDPAPPAPDRTVTLPPGGALPPDLNDLTGRARNLDALRELAAGLAESRRWSGGVAILSGPPGTGKTSLAVRAAYELAGHFPDGQLFLKLRGMSPDPAEPADVLHLLLRSLGIDSAHIPADLDQQAALCRSLLAERAVLIVLDDAADEAQVRPLLVGGRRCLTLVSSRHVLVGLTGASRFGLGVLGQDDAVELLATIIGPARIAAERPAAVALAELCGWLPLALRIAGNRLASRPMWPIDRMVGQLRDGDRRLTTLTAGDLTIRGVFDLSYRQLNPSAAVLFRRLSLVPTGDFSARAATALVDAPDEDKVIGPLEELVDASLLQPTQNDGRYQFHDLLRAFATELLAREETAEAVRSAEKRLVDWLVGTATAAAQEFQPTSVRSERLATSPFRDHREAERWLQAETSNWLIAAGRAAADGAHRQVLDLSEAMHWYSEFDCTADTWYTLFDLARRSAIAIGSKRDEALQRNFLAWVLSALMGRTNEAARMAEEAMAAAVEAGDLCERGWATLYLLSAEVRGGNLPPSVDAYDEALRLFEEAGYSLGQYVARSMRAAYWNRTGLVDEAAKEFSACVAFFSTAGSADSTPVDDNNYAHTLLFSSANLKALGDLDGALAQSEQALELFRGGGAALGLARALQAGGGYLRAMGELGRARERLAEAQVIYARTGQQRAEIDVLCELASLSDELHEPETAHGHRMRALALCETLADPAAVKRLRAELAQHLDQHRQA
ncbi:ATP-binding protein [Lentzea jiangxiensis]|uniref:NB-ARC domain-containing protein n=1 Tax=Lentzea jiangxiensis TaxID=641025 RepID=A0A1H0X365_9PSEU|nr:helix-turn-helix domain-containing protein [Lentzea jiangxiensis]SDP97407.1 NB-ARC domain-containing protein [Lentzea jiangxiensis]